MVSGTNPLMGSAAIQNGLRGGRLFGSGALKGVRRSKAFGTDPEPSSSSSSERSSSSAAAIPPDPRTSISPRSLVTIGVAPKLGAAGAPAPKLGAAGRAELGPVVGGTPAQRVLGGVPERERVRRPSPPPPRGASPCPRGHRPPPPRPARPCPPDSPRARPAARRRACARPPALGAPPRPPPGRTRGCAASVSSLNDPTVFLSRRFRASGSVSTNRQSSGSSRPSRRYSACRNPASNCRALCAARITGAPPPARLASVTYSSRSSAARARRHRGRADHAVGDPGELRDGGRDIEPPGVDQRRHRRVRRVGHVHGGDLDDPVLVLAQTRRLQVERDHDGVSDDRAFAAVADEDALGAMAGMRSSLTGVPPLWGVENEDPEDPPASPHAERRFVSVAGAFSRRCAPLFARWRGGAAAGGFADARGAPRLRRRRGSRREMLRGALVLEQRRTQPP